VNPHKKYPLTKEWLAKKYQEEFYSKKQIAEEVGCSEGKIARDLRIFGITAPKNQRAQRITRFGVTCTFPQLHNKAWLEQEIQNKLSSEIAKELGCTTEAVYYAIHKFKLIEKKVLPEHPHREVVDNKVWLEEQYLQNKLSTNEIGKLTGYSGGQICDYLKKHGIQVRTNYEARVNDLSKNPAESHLYPELNNAEWLYSEYVTKKRALDDIARELGCQNHNSVSQGLRRAGIKQRGISESLCRFRTEIICMDDDIITGSLLGDGFMRRYSKTTNSHACFCKRNKHSEHLEFVVRGLFGPDGVAKIKPEIQKLRGKEYPTNLFRSKVFSELDPYYDIWYPESNNHKKLVPRSINITPPTLLHWFMDDGTARVNNKGRKPRLSFCSESFTKEDQDWLVGEMAKLGLDAYTYLYRHNKEGNQHYRIGIRAANIPKFFELIGPPPVKAMAYKWIKIMPNSHKCKFNELYDMKWMHRQLEVNKVSPKQIQSRLGCSAVTLQAAMARYRKATQQCKQPQTP